MDQEDAADYPGADGGAGHSAPRHPPLIAERFSTRNQPVGLTVKRR